MTWKERVARGLCAQRGCGAPPCDDHDLCPAHREDHRTRNARAMRRARAFAGAQLVLPVVHIE